MQITSKVITWRIYLSLPRIRRKRIDGLYRQIRFGRIPGTKRNRVPVVLVIRTGGNRKQCKNRDKRFTFY